MSEERATVKVVCEKCSYEWDYSGCLEHTTCPNCNRKTKTKYGENKNE